MASKELQQYFPDELPETEDFEDPARSLERLPASATGETQREVLAALERRSDVPSLDLLYARYGLLPHDHVLVGYARQLLARICSDPEIQVEVLAGDFGINAFATKDKTIVLSRQLMGFCRGEEELLGILHHEYKHIKNRHFDEKKRPEARMVDQIMAEVGGARNKELLEADLESLAELDQKGINIDGYFSFMERLGQQETRNGSKKIFEDDIEHGSLQERLLVLKGSLHLRDFKHYKPEESTPLPQELQNPKHFKDDYGFPFQGELERQEERFALRQKNLKELSPRQLFVLLGDLYEKILSMRDLASGKKPLSGSQEYLDRYEPFYKTMRKLAKQTIAARLGCTEEAVQSVIFLRQRMIKDPLAFWENPPEELLAQAKAIPAKAWNDLFPSERLSKVVIFETSTHHDEVMDKLKKRLGREAFDFVERVFEVLYHSQTAFQEKENVSAEPAEEDGEFSKKEKQQLEDIFVRFSSVSRGNLEDGSMSIKEEKILNEQGKPALQKFHREQYFEWIIKELQEVGIRIKNTAMLNSIRKMYIQGGDAESIAALADAIRTTAVSPFEKNVLASVLAVCLMSDEMECKPAKSFKSINTAFSSIAVLFAEKKQEEILSDTRFRDEIKPTGRNVLQYMTVMFADYSAPRLVQAVRGLQKELSLPDDEVASWIQWVFVKRKKPLGLEGYEMLQREFGNLDVGVRQHAEVKMWDEVQEFFCKEWSKHFSPADEENLPRLLDVFEFLLEKTGGEVFSMADTSSSLLFHRIAAQKQGPLQTAEDAMFLLRLSALCTDAVKKNLLVAHAWEAIFTEWETKGPPSIKEFLSQLPPSISLSFFVMERMLEDFAETEEDIHACEEYVKKRVKDEKELGKAIFSQEVFERLMRDKMGLLRDALHPSSDVDLKNRIMRSVKCVIDFKTEISQRVGDVIKSQKLLYPEDQIIYALELNPAAIYRKLYGLDDVHKRLLVHLLLTGESGILKDRTQVGELIDFLFEHFVKQPEDETEKKFIEEARKILKTAASVAKEEELYHLLSQLITPRLLSCEPVNNWKQTEVYRELAGSEYSKRELDGFVNGGLKESREAARMAQQAEYLFQQKDRKTVKPVDTVGLLIEVAGSLGSIGARFLQLMGMYVDVPERYREAHKKAFSELRGQYKATALDTVRQNTPEGAFTNVRLGKRLGGGAMLTSYPFSSDQMEGVLKVVNPNVVAFTESIFTLLEKTLRVLMQEDAEKYGPVLLLLGDIREWVYADLDLAKHAELDTAFREQEEGAQSQDGKLTAHVPQVLFRHPKFLIEERAHGKTLQRVKGLSIAGIRGISNFVRSRYYAQILAGLAHSDVHPGNMILNPAHDVLTWLDRTLLLQLSEEERDLLVRSALASSIEEKLKFFVEGVFEFPENRGVPQAIKEELRHEIEAMREGSLPERLRRAIILVRKHGVKIPLHITLVLKNMQALDQLEGFMETR